jgi:predicted nuclease of predicted toxin-antitoxin system
MRLLLDECMPRKLKFHFAAAGHECQTAREAGLGGVTNGELLAQAELLYDVLITIDANIRYQQSFKNREISLLVLRAPSNDIGDLAPLVAEALLVLKSIQPGQVVEVGPAGS